MRLFGLGCYTLLLWCEGALTGKHSPMLPHGGPRDSTLCSETGFGAVTRDEVRPITSRSSPHRVQQVSQPVSCHQVFEDTAEAAVARGSRQPRWVLLPPSRLRQKYALR